jgi:hypothetical protein
LADYAERRSKLLLKYPEFQTPETAEAGAKALGQATRFIALTVMAARLGKWAEARRWAALGFTGCRHHVAAYRPNLPTWPRAPPKGHGMWMSARVFALSCSSAPLLSAMSSEAPPSEGAIREFREALQIPLDLAEWELTMLREDPQRKISAPPLFSNEAMRAWMWDVWVPALILEDRARLKRCAEAFAELADLHAKVRSVRPGALHNYEYPALSTVYDAYETQNPETFKKGAERAWAAYDAVQETPSQYQFQAPILALSVWKGNPLSDSLTLDLGGALNAFRPPAYWRN